MLLRDVLLHPKVCHKVHDVAVSRLWKPTDLASCLVKKQLLDIVFTMTTSGNPQHKLLWLELDGYYRNPSDLVSHFENALDPLRRI